MLGALVHNRTHVPPSAPHWNDCRPYAGSSWMPESAFPTGSNRPMTPCLRTVDRRHTPGCSWSSRQRPMPPGLPCHHHAARRPAQAGAAGPAMATGGGAGGGGGATGPCLDLCISAITAVHNVGKPAATHIHPHPHWAVTARPRMSLQPPAVLVHTRHTVPCRAAKRRPRRQLGRHRMLARTQHATCCSRQLQLLQQP